MAVNNDRDLSYSFAEMKQYFRENNITISEKNMKKLSNIFSKCDKKDENGNNVKGGDGYLDGVEKEKFMKKVKKQMPGVYLHLIQYSHYKCVSALEAMKDSALKKLEEEEKQLLREREEIELQLTKNRENSNEIKFLKLDN